MLDGPPSLFDRLRRYRTTPGRDSTEDRLTEGLAATLQAAPTAAVALARRIFDDLTELRDEAEVAISTQTYASGLERVDLELLFDVGRPGQLCLWIEVKDWSPALGAQGARYMAFLKSTHRGRWRFAWLLRDGAEVQGPVPDAARVCSWQLVGETLATWADAQPSQRTFGVGLVREYIRHLEELSMAHLAPLTPRHAEALNWHADATSIVSEVMTGAHRLVERGWSRVGQHDRGRDPLHFHGHYSPARQGEPVLWPEERCWFEWRGRRDYLRGPEVRNGQNVLGAGVAFLGPNAPREGHPSGWLEALLAAGFEYGQERNLWFLMRYVTLGDLAQQKTIADQSHWLADQVIEAFDHLAANPPPADAVPPD